MIALVIAAALGALPGGPAPVSATLDPQTLAAGETATLRIELPGGLSISRAPALPVENFEVVAGPSIENQFQWINGKSSSRTTLTYRLRAIRAGPARIGPIRIYAESGWVGEAAAISVRVGEAPPSTENSRAPNADPFLAGKLDPPDPYAGQQAVWTLFLVTRGRAVRAEIKSLPDFRGFWAEDLERDPDPSPQTWNVGGVLWRAYPILRKAIFPERAGMEQIGPATASVSVRSDFFDIFGDPFGEGQVVDRASAPLRVDCRALPPTGDDRPVGSFALKESLRPERLDQGDSATLSLTVSGDGRLSNADPPNLAVAGIRISSPESKLSIRRGGRITSSRTWQWLLTPVRTGSLDIPPLSFTYFDPAARAIRTARTTARTLQVSALPPEPAPETAAGGPSPPAEAARTRFPLPLIAAAAAAGALLVLLAFLAGHRRGAGARPATSVALDPERLLARLEESAARRSPSAREQVLELRRRYDAARFAPELSSREEELRDIEGRIRELARKWRSAS